MQSTLDTEKAEVKSRPQDARKQEITGHQEVGDVLGQTLNAKSPDQSSGVLPAKIVILLRSTRFF